MHVEIRVRLGLASLLIGLTLGCTDSDGDAAATPDAAVDLDVRAVTDGEFIAQDTVELDSESSSNDVLDEDTLAPESNEVGLRLHTLENGPDGRSLPVAIWYPGETPSRDSEPHVYLGFIPKTAYLDLPIRAGGPWPVILFSHGNRGVKEQSVTITEELARAGYVVVAVDHTGNTFFGGAEDTDPLNLIMNHLRPLDLSAALDWLEAPPEDAAWLESSADLTRVGALGHSRGGYTVLAASGADFASFEGYDDACEALESPTCDKYPSGNSPWDLYDPRITSAVIMAPASYTITSDGMKSVVPPTLVMAGKQDLTTTYSGMVRPIYEGLPAPKTLWTSETAGHYTFSDLCRVYDLLGDAAAFLGSDCAGRTRAQIDAAQGPIVNAARAWFDLHLKGLPLDGALTPSSDGEYQVESVP